LLFNPAIMILFRNCIAFIKYVYIQISSGVESPPTRPRKCTDSSLTPSKGILRTAENFPKISIEV